MADSCNTTSISLVCHIYHYFTHLKSSEINLKITSGIFGTLQLSALRCSTYGKDGYL